MYKFALEKFQDCISEMLPLFKLHYQEISANLDIPLCIDMARYQKLEDLGALKIYTARDEDSKEIIGYAVFIISTNLHYISSVQAIQDVVYIHPSRRGFGTGFIARCDEELRDLGVQIVYHHVKTKHEWGRALLKLGYHHVENIYSRRLDKES